MTDEKDRDKKLACLADWLVALACRCWEAKGTDFPTEMAREFAEKGIFKRNRLLRKKKNKKKK